MPRVVPAWRKFTVVTPKTDTEPEKTEIVIEKYMLLSLNAREAIKNGGGEWFLKEPKLNVADKIVTVPSKQLPENSDQRPKRKRSPAPSVDLADTAEAEADAEV